MLRAMNLAMMFVALPLGFASAGAAPEPGANAALKYWQAFATMPKFTEAEQSKLTEELLTMPLDKHAREIVTKAEYALRMMRRGAALAHCDWSYNWEEDGIDALLPHLNAARVLSTLACLRARLEFEEGRDAQAIDDIVDTLTLARHASMDGSLIAVLVGYTIEARTGETLALYLPKLNAAMIKDLKTRLTALPQGGTPPSGLRGAEEKSLDWFIRKVKEAKDKESLLAFLGWIGAGEGKNREAAEKARSFLAECGGSADGVAKFAEEMRPSYALMAGKLNLPLNQFEEEAAREAKKRAGNPVFRILFPALQHARRSQARADVRRALLSAALAVHEEGRDALKNHSDPVVGGSFEYVAFKGGYELRSKWKPDGKAITLTVGQRAKTEKTSLLEGRWIVVSGTVDGDEQDMEGDKVHMARGKFTLEEHGGEVQNGTYKEDTSKNPCHIDFTATEGREKDGVFKGIFIREGNRLTLCLARPGNDRPTEASALEGSGHILMVLKSPPR